MPLNPVMVKSIVTTPMADEVAKRNGVEPINVLTGFKYIGEQIAKLEANNEENRFVFGFEESYGYLAGTYVRDKDAVVASMLICEMAAYYKSVGSSLYEAMQALYKEYGYYLNKVDSFEFEGLSGMDKMAGIMQGLRDKPLVAIAGKAVVRTLDYQTHIEQDLSSGESSVIDLPAANVLQYFLQDGSSVIVRPSGTEPKIKVYYATLGQNEEQAQKAQQALAADIEPLLQ